MQIGRVISPTRFVWRSDTSPRTLPVAKGRLLTVGGLFALLFFALVYRLTAVMVVTETEERHVSAQVVPPLASRAKIVDRNGEILAINLSTGSLYANPKQILDVEEVAAGLSSVFPDLDADQLRAKLSGDKSFVWLKRNLTPKQQQAAHSLGFAGIYFQREEKRFYPYGAATGHVIGYTNIDLEGAGGLERQHNKLLMQGDKPLQVSLDIRVQTVVREALLRGIEKFRAKGGNALVMDVNTGEMIAMVSLPDFDPHMPGKAPDRNRFNANTLGVYEMGSIFKIFTLAMALDSGKVALTDMFDATHDIRVGRFRLTDYRGKKRWLSVPEIFMYSSNIGCIKMIQEVGKDYQLKFFEKMGFFQQVPIAYPERAQPIRPKEWKDINSMTAAYGYGIAVSPLHLGRAVSAVVNGGILINPTFVKQTGAAQGERVMSGRVSDKMRRLMHLAVKEGMVKKTDVDGYVVGGKTGSANKQQGNGYNKKEHLASVVAVFPMTAPRYLVLVTLDAPQATKETFGFATAGWTAAPVNKEIITAIGPLLNVLPEDEGRPEIQEAMYVKVSPNEEKRAIG